MRIVMKISGESLKKDNNITESSLDKLYENILEIKDNNEIIIIPGGGNFWRGRNNLAINKVISDQIGMLGTIMNALAISSYLTEKGISSTCYGAFEISGLI